jgi:uncharacterized membrane protein
VNPFEEAVRLAIGYVVPLVRACGAVAVVLGVARAIVLQMRSFRGHDPVPYATTFPLQLGQSMVLGLEFLVAADILRTALASTWNDIALLSALIALRTVLSYVLERELRVGGAA